MDAVRLCLLLALASATVVNARSDMKCPKERAEGCYCMQNSFLFRGPFVSCSDVRDEDDLRSRVAVLKDNPVDALKLDNLSLPYLPRSGIFADTYIQYLWLSYSSLNYIAPPDQKGPSPFEGLQDSVTEMKIEGMQNFVNVDWTEFSILKKLSKISMYNLKLGEIGESFSKLPASFKNFDVLLGQVTKIAPGAFDLDGLVSVSVDGNKIDKLDRNIFGKNPNLKHITFSNNQVKEVSEDFLDNLPAVDFVALDRNKLTRLPTSLKTNWAQFENIYLQGNRLICDCELLWFMKAAQDNPPKYGDLDFVKCGSPSKLAGRGILTLKETDLCP